jgi:cytochrome c553
MWLCLGNFASQGISADEFEQLSAYMKAIKITPPDKSADDNDCDVGLCPTPDCLA